jgi:hypothetical protein
MKITVTEEHIRNGKPNDPYACPIAKAMRDNFPGAYISVHKTFATYWKGFKKRMSLPHKVQDIIYAYDRNKGMTPFEFELNI